MTREIAEADLEAITTADGARLVCRRRRSLNGTPVILIHGLAVNADIWDLPEVETPRYHYRSLAAMLHERGCDIWLLNLRGHGGPHMLSEPPPGQDDWCVDHFITLDLPAVVDHVREQTGRSPFVIGASMGAMTLAGYLQGARLVGAGEAQQVVVDPEVARQRHDQVAGAVFVEFPAVLRWPAAMFDAEGRVQWDAVVRQVLRGPKADALADANYPFEVLSRWGWLQAWLTAAGEVPLDRLRPSGWGEAVLEAMPPRVADVWRSAERVVAQAGLSLVGVFTGRSNTRAEVMLRGRRHVMDRMKAGVLLQMGESVRRGSFVSRVGGPGHRYPDHYPQIAAPTLVIVGGRDRIAHADMTRTHFFDRIASTDKTFRCFDTMGHGEFEAAPIATERVYPEIVTWLTARDKLASSV